MLCLGVKKFERFKLQSNISKYLIVLREQSCLTKDYNTGEVYLTCLILNSQTAFNIQSFKMWRSLKSYLIKMLAITCALTPAPMPPGWSLFVYLVALLAFNK